MWKLTIEDDEGQRTTLELSDDEYAIGRAEDASIRLTERNVSRRHAVLRPSPEGGWVIEDQGSFNGTFVNGEKIEAATRLSPGDHVQLADYRLELVDHQVAAPPPDEGRRARPDRLVVVIGPAPGTEYPLDGDTATVGRAEDVTVSINHASVSRVHCQMQAIGQGRWEVVDQGSSNGIRINGVELRRGIIEPGDALELGDVRLRYVAAGKFYRPGADMSQELRALLPSFESVMPAASGPVASPVRRGSGLAIAAIIGASILGAGVIGAYVATRPRGASAGVDASDSAAPMATSDEEARKMMDTARGFSDGVGDDDDINIAHGLLGRIPESSPLRDSAEFHAIEDKWADHLFAQAERTTDLDQKRSLLNRISEASTVSAEKRKKAAELAGSQGTAIDLDRGRRDAPHPGGTSTGGAKPASTGTAATAVAKGTDTPPPPDTQEKPDEFDSSAEKRRLMGRMQSGRATLGELNMLKAICMGDGDRNCRNQAVAAANKLKGN